MVQTSELLLVPMACIDNPASFISIRQHDFIASILCIKSKNAQQDFISKKKYEIIKSKMETKRHRIISKKRSSTKQGSNRCALRTGRLFLTAANKMLAVSEHRILTSTFMSCLIQKWGCIFCFPYRVAKTYATALYQECKLATPLHCKTIISLGTWTFDNIRCNFKIRYLNLHTKLCFSTRKDYCVLISL